MADLHYDQRVDNVHYLGGVSDKGQQVNVSTSLFDYNPENPDAKVSLEPVRAWEQSVEVKGDTVTVEDDDWSKLGRVSGTDHALAEKIRTAVKSLGGKKLDYTNQSDLNSVIDDARNTLIHRDGKKEQFKPFPHGQTHG